MKAALAKYIIDYQWVLPADHRVNVFKCVIHTFKNHLIAIFAHMFPDFWWLSGTDFSHILSSLWIFPTPVASINPCQPMHYFWKIWLQSGTSDTASYKKFVAQTTASDTLASFAPHRWVGWYIGPTSAHNFCHQIYVPDTMVKCNIL